MSDNTKPKASQMVLWMRSTFSEKATFTSNQAQAGTGYQAQYTSTALSYLIEQGTYGVQRISTGNYLYDPAFDSGRQAPRKEAAMNLGTVPDTGLTGRIITYMHQHPNQVRTIPQVAEAIDGIDSSTGNALKRLAERGQAGIVMLARGVFQYQPEPAAEEPSSTPVSDLFNIARGNIPPGGRTPKYNRPEPEPAPRFPFAPAPEHKAGDMFELVGSGESGMLIVRSETGKLFKLTEL